jgi:hypothetical protein
VTILGLLDLALIFAERHGEGEESLGELTGGRSGWKTKVFGSVVMNGGGGVRVHVHVDEVGELWRTKGCRGRSSGGECLRLSVPFVPT